MVRINLLEDCRLRHRETVRERAAESGNDTAVPAATGLLWHAAESPGHRRGQRLDADLDKVAEVAGGQGRESD
jgi:hypothetical protein